ncbi:MAG TPA: molybdate ABC transporter substrate-binding protein [Limnobacter sp.]|nr:molybdate ABC transporter substrate-binding protein [Limnobacter sp.]
MLATFLARFLLGVMACVHSLGWPVSAQAETVTVATAATMRYAFEEILQAFEKQTGHSVKAVYGSSGNFVSQIRQGAPFDLFVAADMEYPEMLRTQGLAQGRVQEYARGRLVLMVPADSPLKPDGTLIDLKDALRDGRLKKLAIANPRLAPYGARAQEALEHAGLWAAIAPKLVLGENISQAAQFASTGAAQGGLVALSLALAPQLRTSTRHGLVPEAWHQPLAQGVVMLKSNKPAAQQLQRFLLSASSQSILKRYGYEVPNAGGSAPQ